MGCLARRARPPTPWPQRAYYHDPPHHSVGLHLTKLSTTFTFFLLRSHMSSSLSLSLPLHASLLFFPPTSGHGCYHGHYPISTKKNLSDFTFSVNARNTHHTTPPKVSIHVSITVIAEDDIEFSPSSSHLLINHFDDLHSPYSFPEEHDYVYKTV